MTTEQWLTKYQENLPKFKWFIYKYFDEDIFLSMDKAYEAGNTTRLMSILGNVWFYLPDSKFNIIENPPGWAELLELVENPPIS